MTHSGEGSNICRRTLNPRSCKDKDIRCAVLCSNVHKGHGAGAEAGIAHAPGLGRVVLRRPG